MALDLYFEAGMFRQYLDIFREYRPGLLGEVILIKLKIDIFQEGTLPYRPFNAGIFFLGKALLKALLLLLLLRGLCLLFLRSPFLFRGCLFLL